MRLSTMTQKHRDDIRRHVVETVNGGMDRINLSGTVVIALLNDADQARQLLEGCKKALTCASLPDAVKEVIRQAIAGTLPID